MPTMRDALHAGTCPSSAADSVACFLARLHTTAPSHALLAAAKQEVTDSSNRVTDSNRARAEAALFSWPFEGARELLDVEKETSLVAAAGELHAVFDTHRQHHVHGNLHTGAVADAATAGLLGVLHRAGRAQEDLRLLRDRLPGVPQPQVHTGEPQLLRRQP